MTEINIGDKIKATYKDGTVVTGVVNFRVEDDPDNGMADYLEVGSALGMYKSDGWEFEVLVPAPRVGGVFTPDLPLATVIKSEEGRYAFKAARGWVFVDESFVPNADISPKHWTIDYLP